LREQLGDDRSGPHFSGTIALSHAGGSSDRTELQVDRVQAAEHFWQFCYGERRPEEWRDRGVLFLGGDQFFPVVIGLRLGYRTVVYAVGSRWHRSIDRFG